MNNRYRLIERLDHGSGQAEVWRARDARLESDVILKTYNLGDDARARAQQYAAERDALGRGIIGVPRLRDSYQDANGALTLVRDHVPGLSLRSQVLLNGPFTVDRSCAIVASAARIAHAFHTDEPRPLALADLHAAHFVLEAPDTVWWIDAGSASPLLREKSERPNTALSALVTPSPEQFAGASVASDIWGLGCLFFFILTGHDAPKGGADPALEYLHGQLPNLPDEVIHFVRATLAVDPAHRLPTAQAAAEALGVIGLMRTGYGPPPIPPLPVLAVRRISMVESPVAHALKRGSEGSTAWARLSQSSAQLRGSVYGDELTALATLDIDIFEHQLETARRVLTSSTMSGGAVLADEVGLGKTIEALLIFQEMRARRMADTALIVATPQGVATWMDEVRARIRSSAYERGFRVYQTPEDAGYPHLVVSSATLRQAAHNAALSRHPYDLVIVDEAHTLCGSDGRPNALGRAIAGLTRKRVLLLTATPIRKRLRELYTLISLIRPGLLGTIEGFIDRFEANTDQSADERRALRAMLDGSMVRHRRRDLSGITFPTRTYRRIRFSASRRSAVPRARYHALAALVNETSGQRMVIFLADAVERGMAASALSAEIKNRPVVLFGGDRTERRLATAAFQAHPSSVLLAGDTGSEGMNWQSARVIVHGDLPWSPSVWEQRVGRVYRLGQRAGDVEIVHVFEANGRDEAVLDLFEYDLKLFELAIGEVASLLDYVPDPAERDMEACIETAFRLARIRSTSKNLDRSRAALDAYRAVICQARDLYDISCQHSDVLDLVLGLSL